MDTPPSSHEASYEKPVILFDGVCNLCNGSVKFILKRDKWKSFLLAPLQSETGRALLVKANLPTNDFNSMVVIDGDRVHTRSSAVLRIMKDLGALWPLLYVLTIVPKPWRDACYNIVARNRYTWFGRSDACMVPTEDLKDRFLEMS